MRIMPNHPRLRVIALFCWTIGIWWMLQAMLMLVQGLLPTVAAAAAVLISTIMLAVGVAYWQLSGDQRAGIVFDAKGLMLNLGNTSSFIAWENIESVGVCRYRDSLLTLGSSQQLGIALRDATPYMQSYEQRLPATCGPLARGLRMIHNLICRYQSPEKQSLEALLTIRRSRTGYDILVPEPMLGGSVEGFVSLVETYRTDLTQRAALGRWI